MSSKRPSRLSGICPLRHDCDRLIETLYQHWLTHGSFYNLLGMEFETGCALRHPREDIWQMWKSCPKYKLILSSGERTYLIQQDELMCLDRKQARERIQSETAKRDKYTLELKWLIDEAGHQFLKAQSVRIVSELTAERVRIQQRMLDIDQLLILHDSQQLDIHRAHQQHQTLRPATVPDVTDSDTLAKMAPLISASSAQSSKRAQTSSQTTRFNQVQQRDHKADEKSVLLFQATLESTLDCLFDLPKASVQDTASAALENGKRIAETVVPLRRSLKQLGYSVTLKDVERGLASFQPLLKPLSHAKQQCDSVIRIQEARLKLLPCPEGLHCPLVLTYCMALIHNQSFLDTWDTKWIQDHLRVASDESSGECELLEFLLDQWVLRLAENNHGFMQCPNHHSLRFYAVKLQQLFSRCLQHVNFVRDALSVYDGDKSARFWMILKDELQILDIPAPLIPIVAGYCCPQFCYVVPDNYITSLRRNAGTPWSCPCGSVTDVAFYPFRIANNSDRPETKRCLHCTNDADLFYTLLKSTKAMPRNVESCMVSNYACDQCRASWSTYTSPSGHTLIPEDVQGHLVDFDVKLNQLIEHYLLTPGSVIGCTCSNPRVFCAYHRYIPPQAKRTHDIGLVMCATCRDERFGWLPMTSLFHTCVDNTLQSKSHCLACVEAQTLGRVPYVIHLQRARLKDPTSLSEQSGNSTKNAWQSRRAVKLKQSQSETGATRNQSNTEKD